jgi:hypothetical protein
MNIFDIQKDRLWRNGNIMKFGLSLGQTIEYFHGLEFGDMFDTLGMFYDGQCATMSKPSSCQRS